jgi:signal transduction histidine kinase
MDNYNNIVTRLIKNYNELFYNNKNLPINQIISNYLELLNSISFVNVVALFSLKQNNQGFINLKTIPEAFEQSVTYNMFQLFNHGILTKSLNFKQILFTDSELLKIPFKNFIFPLVISNEPIGIISVYCDFELECLPTNIQDAIMIGNIALASYIINSRKNKEFDSSQQIINQQIIDKTLRYNQSLNQIKYILETLPIGFFLLDPDTKEILDTNLYTEKLSGANKATLISSYRDFFIVNYVDDNFEIVDFNFSPTPLKTYFKDINDNIYPILLFSNFLEIDNKSFVIEVFIDNTMQDKLIKEISILKNKQYQLFTFRNEVIGNISRELINPLNDIIGISEILESELSNGNLELVNVINKAAQQLNTIIQALIDWTTFSITEVNSLRSKIELKKYCEKIQIILSSIFDKIFIINDSHSSEFIFIDEWILDKYLIYSIQFYKNIIKLNEIKILLTTNENNLLQVDILLYSNELNINELIKYNLYNEEIDLFNNTNFDYKYLIYYNTLKQINNILHCEIKYFYEENYFKISLTL